MKTTSQRIVNKPILLTLMLIYSVTVFAQSSKSSESQNPAPINTFEIEGGYKFDYKADGKDEGWYRISYKGSLIRGEGTPFKYAQGLNLLTPPLTMGTGDTNRLLLRFERGTTTIGGGLFEALGLQPLNFRGLQSLDLRGMALAAGDADGKNLEFAVGLESRPYRIPGFHRTQASNWVVVGVNAHHQENTDSETGDEDIGLLTYRAFLGQAFGWRKSADVGKTADKLVSDILSEAPTYTEAKNLEPQVIAIPANERSSIQQLFLDMVGEATSDADWEKTVKEIAYGQADAITDQPTFALYAESSGWYAFSNNFGGDRFKNLFTVSFDYWFLPKRDDVFLRVRYENGFERATPLDSKNHLLMSLALRF